MPLIARKVAPDSVVYTDGYRSYNALDVSDFYHERIGIFMRFDNIFIFKYFASRTCHFGEPQRKVDTK